MVRLRTAPRPGSTPWCLDTAPECWHAEGVDPVSSRQPRSLFLGQGHFLLIPRTARVWTFPKRDHQGPLECGELKLGSPWDVGVSVGYRSLFPHNVRTFPAPAVRNPLGVTTCFLQTIRPFVQHEEPIGFFGVWANPQPDCQSSVLYTPQGPMGI